MNKTIIICLWILFLCTNILQAKIYNVKDFGAVGAMESGVARKQITDWDEYKNHLRELMGQENKLTRQLYKTTRRNTQRVIFAEGHWVTFLIGSRLSSSVSQELPTNHGRLIFFLP